MHSIDGANAVRKNGRGTRSGAERAHRVRIGLGPGVPASASAEFLARPVALADTSKSAENIPSFAYETVEELTLPTGCSLVGVELTPDAIPRILRLGLRVNL